MSYTEAKKRYAALGIDTDAAMKKLKDVPVSLHCWQGDDVRGFDTDPSKPLTGGIQTTGNYPGRARTPEELMASGRTGTSWSRSTSESGLSSAGSAAWAATSTPRSSPIRNAIR